MAFWKYKCYEYRKLANGHFHNYSFGGLTFESVVKKLSVHMKKHTIIASMIQAVDNEILAYLDWCSMQRQNQKQIRKLLKNKRNVQ